MKRLLIGLFLLALALPAGAGAAQPRVLAIHFDTEVNPVTQDWVNHELGLAQSRGYDAAVILLDTPGGLEESMRKIVQRELSLRIPIVVYVTPGGARAASAGDLDLRGGRPAGNGGGDEHRFLDADQRQRAEHRQ